MRVLLQSPVRTHEADAWEDLLDDSFAFSSAMPRQGRRTASAALEHKRAAPAPYSEARLDTNATIATPLTRRAAVRLKTAADQAVP